MTFLMLCQVIALVAIGVFMLFVNATLKLLSERIDRQQLSVSVMSRGIQLLAGDDEDFPHIRASRQCPICDLEKEAGLLCCWACYSAYDLRHGITADLLRRFEDREFYLTEESGR